MIKCIKQFKNLSIRERRIVIISGLVILSFFSLLFANQYDLKLSISNTFFQLIASWILSYVFMIVGTILWGLLLRVETDGV